MRRLLVACLSCAVCGSADTGVLIPGDRQQPVGTDNGLVRLAEEELR